MTANLERKPGCKTVCSSDGGPRHQPKVAKGSGAGYGTADFEPYESVGGDVGSRKENAKC